MNIKGPIGMWVCDVEPGKTYEFSAYIDPPGAAFDLDVVDDADITRVIGSTSQDHPAIDIPADVTRVRFMWPNR